MILTLEFLSFIFDEWGCVGLPRVKRQGQMNSRFGGLAGKRDVGCCLFNWGNGVLKGARKSKVDVPVSKPKILKSVSAKNTEPSQSRGSIVLNVPYSSLDECRSSKLFSGLGHKLFSIGQFCVSNLEVAFRQHTCFIRNLEGVDLLTGSQGNNLYTLPLGDMTTSSLICLLSKASKTKSWLWHRRLSHLNFGAINHLARHGLVRGLPKLKFENDHLYSTCAMGKSKKKLHKPKSEDTNQEKLYLLHMDLCGPMHVASVNGKKYILVIVDDYSRFIWVKFFRIDNGTEFVNQNLREYYEKVAISHETSVARSPQQNGVAEGQLLPHFSSQIVPIAVFVTTKHHMIFYMTNHDLSFFHVFGALCYPTNDSENLDFDELTVMASKQSSSGPALHEMTPSTISSGLISNPPPSTPFIHRQEQIRIICFNRCLMNYSLLHPVLINQPLKSLLQFMK
ncbi:retrovirus-related pol polyprotein from transposon TNT 1-94 [Tanacetum coccineum]